MKVQNTTRMKTKIESEKLLEFKLNNAISELGGWSIKLMSTISGLPDRLCLMPGGQVFFVEMKTTGKKPRKIQTAMMVRLKKLGFDTYVIDSSEQIKHLTTQL